MPFGYTYSRYIKESVYDPLTTTQKDFISLRACVVRDEDVSTVKGLKEFSLNDTTAQAAFNMETYAQGVAELGRDSMVTEKFEENHISGKINVSEDKMMYLSMPYDAGWTLKVDGQTKEKAILFAGMTGVMLPKGQHTIDLVFDLRYYNKGFMMMGLGLLLCGGLWFYTRKMNQKQATEQA